MGNRIGKVADAMTVNRGLGLSGEGKIEEICADLSLEPVSSFKIRLEIHQGAEEPHITTYQTRGVGGRSSSQSEMNLLA